jgi:signal transduction histidine kinase/ligand-binding sensor domain-containing protein
LKNSSTFRNRMIQGHRLGGWLLAGLAGVCLVNAASALDSTKAMSQYIHEKWGVERGYLGGTVYAICQSDDGYLWIGTDRGLVQFDGFNFKLIQRPLPDGPPIGPVRGLVSDVDGNLWIRLDGPHLLVYHDGRFEDAFSRFDLQDVAFTAMSLDGNGDLFLSGLGHPILRYRKGKFETVANAEEVSGTVMAVAETRDGRIWMGTRDEGLFRVDHGLVSNVSRELADSKVNALLPANNGGLWIGTDAGIKFWNGSGLDNTDLPSSINQLHILAMTKDQEANVWVGTDHGLIRITSSGAVSFDLVNRSPGNAITAVYEDRDGDLWFGGSSGIERLQDGVFTTYSTAQGLPSDNNGPIYVDSGGRTWFAPLSGGLFRLQDGRVERIPLAGLNEDVVYSISGGNGEIWIGRQRDGLTVLTKNGDSFVARTYTQSNGLTQNSVYSVHRNRDGTVWAGTVSAGVSRLKDDIFTNYSMANGLASNSVNSIVEGFDGTMWFATPGGLDSFTNGRWRNRSTRDGLPSSDVRTIFEDSKHVLWVATSGGLAFLASGHVRVPHNLPESLREQIVGIAEDRRGSLWIATSDHLLQVDRDRLLMGSLEDSDVQSYGVEDGLQGVEGVRRDRSVVADPLGRVWVSLNHGLAMSEPKVTPRSATPVMVRIQSVSAGGSQVNLKSSPKIAPGSQSITFNYAGTSLSAPERVRFRYKLDGSDRGWSDIVASRQVVYSHLGPGSYTFRVVASNREGLWNGPETAVPFVIEPALWQTWWFRASCLSLCLFVIAALYRLRMYQLTRQLNVRFHERLAERTRIAQQLHDTLLQGFLGASMQLDVAEEQVPDDSPAKPLLRRVLQLMGQVNEEGRNALRDLRTAENDHRDLEMAFSRMRQEFAVEEKVGYRVIANGVTRPLRPSIRDDVYRIGREAIVNAFLHARANTIEVEVEYASKYFRILVRDDGRGIDPQVLQAGREGHWGLPGMRERSEGIGASLRLRSRIAAGTEIELTVPGAIAFEGPSHRQGSPWLAWLSRVKFETAAGWEKKRGQK